MINLLPELQKNQLRIEYRLRLIIVVLTLIAILLGLSIVLLIPSYALVLYKGRVAETSPTNVTDISFESDQQKDLTDRVKRIDTSLKVLSTPDKEIQPSALIAALVARKVAGIKILNITYIEKSGGGFDVGIQGIASTRQNLQTFVTELQKEKKLGVVDVPVSNFAKDTNISFAITTQSPQ